MPLEMRAAILIAIVVSTPTAMASAQAGGAAPVEIGQLLSANAGDTVSGWTVIYSGCDPAFTVCGTTFWKGNNFYVAQTKVLSYRPNKPIVQRITAITHHVRKRGEDHTRACYVDNQFPALALASGDRRSVRAVVLDKNKNFVEVLRPLRQPHSCDFDEEY